MWALAAVVWARGRAAQVPAGASMLMVIEAVEAGPGSRTGEAPKLGTVAVAVAVQWEGALQASRAAGVQAFVMSPESAGADAAVSGPAAAAPEFAAARMPAAAMAMAVVLAMPMAVTVMVAVVPLPGRWRRWWPGSPIPPSPG
jgi:hypothetical protein